jgi:hypothetical protein
MARVRVLRGAAVALLVCLQLNALGCATVETVDTVRAPSGQKEQPPNGQPALIAHAKLESPQRLVLRLSHAQCLSYDVERVTETTYSAPSRTLAWTLLLGGAALGGLGTAWWLSAKDKPESCAASDTTCDSRGQAKARGVLSWGLGGAGVVVGGVQLLQQPKRLGEPQEHPEMTPRQAPVHDCVEPLGKIQIQLMSPHFARPIEATTDDSGLAVFEICRDEAATPNCIDASQLGILDRANVTIVGHSIAGTLSMGSVRQGGPISEDLHTDCAQAVCLSDDECQGVMQLSLDDCLTLKRACSGGADRRQEIQNRGAQAFESMMQGARSGLLQFGGSMVRLAQFNQCVHDQGAVGSIPFE